MRSILAAAAALWFIYNAAFFVPDGIGVSGGAMTGDPSAFAVMSAARAAFVGLTFIALALVDWAHIGDAFKPDE